MPSVPIGSLLAPVLIFYMTDRLSQPHSISTLKMEALVSTKLNELHPRNHNLNTVKLAESGIARGRI